VICLTHPPGGLLPFATARFSPKTWNAPGAGLPFSCVALRSRQITEICDCPASAFLAQPSLFNAREPFISKEELLWTIERYNVPGRLLCSHS
jgi:hypothetical protein